VATRALGPALLLLALLSACGNGDAAPPPAADPAAGIEEGTPTPAAGQSAAAAGPRQMRVDSALIPEPGQPIQRENYAYSGGTRDPFLSVLEGNATGPELADLDLVGIMYNPRAPATSVATLRDRLNLKIFTVREGDRLGRMRVTDIRQKDVTFTIDDYGTERQETLTLRKQEGNAP
jgi:hypothetical protein